MEKLTLFRGDTIIVRYVSAHSAYMLLISLQRKEEARYRPNLHIRRSS